MLSFSICWNLRYPPFDGPFNYNDSLNTDDIARLKQYGFNMVRLGVMWPGTETAPGVYVISLLTLTFNLYLLHRKLVEGQ